MSGPFLFGREGLREHFLAHSDQPGVAEASLTYKEPKFVSQLKFRGFMETGISSRVEEDPPNTQEETLGFQPLDEDTIETFNQCLEPPENEPSIQGVIVITLVNLHNIMRSPTTHGGLKCQFNAESSFPVILGMVEIAARLTVPWPNAVIGLRRSSFQEYMVG